MQVQIPPTIEEAIEDLNGLSALLTATEWQKAAIVYAFTNKSEGRGKRNVSSDISFVEFAGLGIAGLSSKNTVQKYHQAWAEHGDTSIKQGDRDVDLPDVEWPPMSTPAQEKFVRIPEGSDPKEVARKMPEDTRIDVAKELMIDPDVREAVIDDLIREDADNERAEYTASKPKSLDLFVEMMAILGKSAHRMQEALDLRERHPEHDWSHLPESRSLAILQAGTTILLGEGGGLEDELAHLVGEGGDLL